VYLNHQGPTFLFELPPHNPWHLNAVPLSQHHCEVNQFRWEHMGLHFTTKARPSRTILPISGPFKTQPTEHSSSIIEKQPKTRLTKTIGGPPKNYGEQKKLARTKLELLHIYTNRNRFATRKPAQRNHETAITNAETPFQGAHGCSQIPELVCEVSDASGFGLIMHAGCCLSS
jgi:hypothetical protein